MTGYLLTLRPTEPYFFGNEKTFSFDADPTKSRYFIKSEVMPSQTTLLGALRYCLMPVKHADFRYSAEETARNAKIIGDSSFDMEKQEQTFGAILGISPVFLTRGQQKYIRTPFDHRISDDNKKPHSSYTPLTGYETVPTDRGQRWFARDFHTKDGLTDSFMDVENGQLVPACDIFGSQVRVGINKEQDKKAFFKKQFSVLMEGWAFAAYVSLDSDTVNADPDAAAALDALAHGTPVYLGQSKSVFIAQLVPQENTMAQGIAKHLGDNAVYCFGDTLAAPDIYDHCLFAAVKLQEHRALQTDLRSGSGKIAKSPVQYKLISAGSVLLSEDPAALVKALEVPHCSKIGFNVFVTNKEA